MSPPVKPVTIAPKSSASGSSSSSMRQRVSWILLFIYLGGTFYFVHYLFDISDSYSQLALDHAKHFRKKDRHLLSIYEMIAEHLFNVPFSWWLVILLVPYISIFALLITCTRSECVLLNEACEEPGSFFSVCCTNPAPKNTHESSRGAASARSAFKTTKYQPSKVK